MEKQEKKKALDDLEFLKKTVAANLPVIMALYSQIHATGMINTNTALMLTITEGITNMSSHQEWIDAPTRLVELKIPPDIEQLLQMFYEMLVEFQEENGEQHTNLKSQAEFETEILTKMVLNGITHLSTHAMKICKQYKQLLMETNAQKASDSQLH